MAFTDKNLVITPSVGSSGEDPKIVFSGADSSLGPQSLTARIYPSSNGTLSFEGSAGQLFSITNSLTGTIYSVNDASGLPSIEVFEDGVIRLARYSGRVVIGDAVDNGVDSIQFAGNTSFQFASLNANGTFTSTGQMVSLLADGTAPLVVQSSTLVANLNADLLDSQQGSYYLDWTNTTNKPDPKITVTLTGDVTGSANTTLTDLADGTISIATTVVSNSVTLGTDTTGNYVATIAGTPNQVTVTGSGSESAAVTLSLPQNIHTAATPTFAGLLINAGEGLELKNGGDRTSSPTLGGWTPNDTRLINLRDTNGSTDGALLVTRDGTTAGDANVELIYIDASNFEWKGNKIWHAGNDGSGSGLDADTVDGKDIGTSGNKIPLLDGTNTWSNSQTFSATANFTDGGNQILMKAGVSNSPTVIHRNDGTNYYVLLSDAGTSANGTWNTLRPLTVNLTTGLLSSSNGQDFRGGTVFNDNSADVDFRVESNNDVNALFVDGGTDRVGIGTSSPNNKLDVIYDSTETSLTANVGTGVTAGLRINNANTTTNTYAYIDLRAGSSDVRLASVNKGTNTSDFVILNDNGDTTIDEQLRITSTGAVGIGTSTPGTKLAVAGLITELYNSTYWNVVSQADIGTDPNQVPLNQYLGQLAFADEYSPSGLRRTGAGSNDLSVDSNGNVGIGTASPGTLLHVYGATDPTIKIQSDGTDEISGRLSLRQSNDTGADILYDGTNSVEALVVKTYSGGTYQADGMRISLAGDVTLPQNLSVLGSVVINENSADVDVRIEGNNDVNLFFTDGGNDRVGIGTNAPGEKLDVRGNLRVGGADAGPNYIAFRGTTGDAPGSYNHGYIGERIHTSTESSELLLFKGNDPSTSGPDRIRLAAADIVFDTYSTATSGTFEEVATSANVTTKAIIKNDGKVGIGTNAPDEKLHIIGNTKSNTFISTVATGTAPFTIASTTTVTNLNADFLDNQHGSYYTNASNLSTGTVPGDRGVTAGSTSSSFVEYNGTTATAGQWYGGTTAPSETTRLNYGGYLYATRFYGDGNNLTAIKSGDQTFTVYNYTASISGNSQIAFSNRDGASADRIVAKILGETTDNGGNGKLTFYTASSVTLYKGFELDSGSNIALYNTSSVQKFKWDASNESVNVDKIISYAGAAATAQLFGNVTTGSVTIAGGLTTGTLNLGASAVGAKTINIGTSTGATIINGSLTINESSADVDVRIEGNNDVNLFFTDGGNDRVGIGTNSPSQKLDVNGVTKSSGYWIDNISYLDTATSTTTSISQIAHISFSTSSFGSGEITIQATSGVNRHLTKLLVSHDGTTAYATEYGTIKTGASLFACDVDINSGNVRILITPASTSSTVFKTSYTLIAA